MMNVQFAGKPMTKISFTADEVREQYELALAAERAAPTPAAICWREFWERAHLQMTGAPITLTLE